MCHQCGHSRGNHARFEGVEGRCYTPIDEEVGCPCRCFVQRNEDLDLDLLHSLATEPAWVFTLRDDERAWT